MHGAGELRRGSGVVMMLHKKELRCAGGEIR